jgi:hypothetical protein
MSNPKILVSIVSYKDPEFYASVKSLWETAQYKDSIIFSLVDEDDEPKDFSFIPEANLIYRHYPTTKYYGGLCWARNLATKVDVEYDYFMQFDSHTRGRYGWDKRGYENYKYIETAFPETKVMISYAPPSYSHNEIGEEVFEGFEGDTNYGKCGLDYKEFAPGYEFPRYANLRATEVIKSHWTTCMYIFVPKLWVDEVGVDEFGSFNTEEFNQSLRTFAHGWSVYAVGAKDVFHQWHLAPLRQETKGIRRPWGDNRKEAYWEHVKQATNHLGRILKGLEDVPLKKVEEFFEATSIDKSWLSVEGEYFKGRGGATYLGVPQNPRRYSA